jgi:hypothetical protein
MNDTGTVRFNLNCINIEQNLKNRIDTNGFIIQIFHLKDEPSTVNRIMISRKDLEIEILPSKGFSIGKVSLGDKPTLWDAPIGLPDPLGLDFRSDKISIFGTPTPGFTYLRTFVGGIELLGLKNWGMPRTDTLTGEFLPLHGEVSNIPLEKIEFEISKKGLLAKGTIIYRTMKGDDKKPWWERGPGMYKITKSLFIDPITTGFIIADTITNISNASLVPDWGYHVTFWPEPGSKILVPSLTCEERGRATVAPEFDTWHPALNEKIRTEVGIIFKELKVFDFQGKPSTRILKLYPDGRAFELIVPITQYFQTWNSSGGSDSKEFTYNDGKPVFSKSWNGFGVEIGSSPLDYNGNTDKSVMNNDTLNPGEQLGIRIALKMIDPPATKQLKDEIELYNSGRK